MVNLMPKDSVPVLRLKQWIDSWDDYQYEESAQRRKPEPYIFVFAMSASKLRSYSDVYQRNRSPQEVSGIQRGREESRINRIRRFIQEGYPYSDLKENQHSNYEYLVFARKYLIFRKLPYFHVLRFLFPNNNSFA